jgi:archaemetzincin
MRISLVLAGRSIPGFTGLIDSVSRTFHTPVSTGFVDFPFTRSFRRARKQYDAGVLLSELSRCTAREGRVVFIIREDMFSAPMNFVFGFARGDSAIVSTARLDPRFYGPVGDLGQAGALFKERVLKEVLHELGHLHGLPHCEDAKCTMVFSESIEGVDRKGADFCPGCRAALHLDV